MKKRMLNLTVFYTLLLCLLMVSAAVGEVSAKPDVKGNNRDRELSVMTRNMYLGTDFTEIFAAQSSNELVSEVAEAYAEVQAGSPAERIAGIADEIQVASPTLIGLQEVALWRIGAPFDPSSAEIVTYDFLKLLLEELEKRGLHYAPVAIQTNFDAEVPAVYNETLAFDVRFTDRLVVLARTDLKTSEFKLEDTQAHNFAINLTLPTSTLGTLTIPRGWISVDVKMRGKNYRFVNTHLESFSSAINLIQAKELLQKAGNTNLPLIFAGDFNSDAEADFDLDDEFIDSAFELLLRSGFKDVWKVTHPSDPGFTWALFLNDPSDYTPPTQRLDLILVRGRIDPLDSDIVGENPSADRTLSGLMRSDHAGVTALLRLKP